MPNCEKCGRPKCDCPERSHRIVLDGKTCHGDCQPKEVKSKYETSYCVKCRSIKEMTDVERREIPVKEGGIRPAISGKCLDCGTGMYKLLRKDTAKDKPNCEKCGRPKCIYEECPDENVCSFCHSDCQPKTNCPCVERLGYETCGHPECYQAGLRDGQAKLGEVKRVAYMQGYEDGKKDNQKT